MFRRGIAQETIADVNGWKVFAQLYSWYSSKYIDHMTDDVWETKIKKLVIDSKAHLVSANH